MLLPVSVLRTLLVCSRFALIAFVAVWAMGIISATICVSQESGSAQLERVQGSMTIEAPELGTHNEGSGPPSLWQIVSDQSGLTDEQIKIINSARAQYAEAYYTYLGKKLLHAEESLRIHRASSMIITFLVVFIVFGGVILSFMQFAWGVNVAASAIKKLENSAIGQDQGNGQMGVDTHTISGNRAGLTVTTSYIGLAILALSFLFFISYVGFVYPLQFKADTAFQGAGERSLPADRWNPGTPDLSDNQ